MDFCLFLNMGCRVPGVGGVFYDVLCDSENIALQDSAGTFLVPKEA
jgi:hypothetical protein